MNSYIKLVAFLGLLIMASCQPTIQQYQKQVNIPNGSWSSSLQPEFELDIKDTSGLYDVYILLRNDNTYSVSNIWLKMYVMPPGQSTYKVYDRIELGLADASGKWIGRNFGDMWETRTMIAAGDSTIFTLPGTYKIKFEQIMRTDPLLGVLNVGVNVTKK